MMLCASRLIVISSDVVLSIFSWLEIHGWDQTDLISGRWGKGVGLDLEVALSVSVAESVNNRHVCPCAGR